MKINSLFSVKGKTAIVTGGSRGIGYSTTKLLCDKHNVFVASRTNENLSNLNCKYINFDVNSQDGINTQLPESIDGLVYCTGSINLKPFKNLKTEDFINDFNINVIYDLDTKSFSSNIVSNKTAINNRPIIFDNGVVI